MKNISYPAYLIPLESLETVEVVGHIREKSGADNAQKRETWTGENRPGWVVPIEFIRGTRLKTLPNGQQLESLETELVNVTVWAYEKPNIGIGDYIAFEKLSVGAMNGKSYFQALGVVKKEEEFELNFEGEVDGND